MEKQICAQCRAAFEYDMKPGYPRKYCDPCSAAKKAMWNAKQTGQAPMPVAVPVAKTPDRNNSIVSQVMLKLAVEMLGMVKGDMVASDEEEYLCQSVQILAKVYKVGISELEK